MTSPFEDLNTLRGSAFFKPEQHKDDLALIVEPVRVDKDVRSVYNGIERVRDEAIADITVFKTAEAVEKGEPSEVLKAVKISQVMLVGTIQTLIDRGSITLGVLRKVPTKAGSGWAFRPVEGEGIVDKVAAYYNGREAAEAAAVAAAPGFDD